jgi:hypothetical protein
MRLLIALLVGTGVAAAQADTADLEASYLRVIAKWADQSEHAVRALRQRLGAYTELAPLLRISRLAGVPPGELLEQRDDGMTWAEIARDRKIRIVPGTDFIDESNVQALARYYRRPLEEVRGMRRGDMSFLRLNEELQRSEKSRSP